MDTFEKSELSDGATQYSLFDGRATLLQTGTQFGSVEFCNPTYAAQVQRLKTLSRLPHIAQMYSNGGNTVTDVDELKELIAYPDRNVYATATPTDGYVLSSGIATRLGTLQTNADCPAIVLLRDDGALAHLHGALDCLDKENDVSVICNAIRKLTDGFFDVQDIRAFVAVGAAKCCFGHKASDPDMHARNEARSQRVQNRFGSDVVGVVKNSPRDGGISYDLFEIARRQLEKFGVAPGRIALDAACISCEGLDSVTHMNPDVQGKYFSHLRQSPLAMRQRGYGERNATLAWSNS